MRLIAVMIAAALTILPANAGELRDAPKNQGDQQDHPRHSRSLGAFQLSGRGPKGDRMPSILHEDRRRGQARTESIEHCRRELPVTSSNRIPLMMNGTVDLVCSSTTNNAERQRQVAFTNSHFLSATRFAARKSDNITTIDQLKGKPVVAISGSTNMVQLNQVNTARNLGITALAAKDQAEAFLMLEPAARPPMSSMTYNSPSRSQDQRIRLPT